MLENPIKSIFNNFRRQKQPAPVIEKTSTPENSHVRWAKDRALALLDKGDLHGAISSMVNDLSKPRIHENPNLRHDNSLASAMAVELLETPNLDAQRVKEFIEGFAD